MKKILIYILAICTILLCSCKKEQKIYTGSVMIYSTLEKEPLNALKQEFEKTYRGITLDYYHSREERVTKLLENEYSTGKFDGDVLLGFDFDTYSSFKEKGYFETYKAKDSRKFPSNCKDKENTYIGIAKEKKDEDEVVVMAALLKNSPNVGNGKLFMDFLLSKKTKEIFEGNDFVSLR